MTAQLGLGTVQFGLRYGVANAGAEVEATTVAAVLATARAEQISVIDTAAQYGASEERLGENDLSGFTIVTKTPKLADLDRADARRAVISAARRSLVRLGLERIDALLVHGAGDLLGANGDTIHAALLDLCADGAVRRIGVSVYDADELDCLRARYRLDVVQLPVNVFDQRLVRSGHLGALADAGVVVHARSVYLQGALLMVPDALPQALSRFRPVIADFQAAAREQGMTPQQAALGWVRDVSGVDIVLTGAMDSRQLIETARAFRDAPPFEASMLAQADPDLLDPRQWAL